MTVSPLVQMYKKETLMASMGLIIFRLSFEC